jgi:signal transduction histidine kinase
MGSATKQAERHPVFPIGEAVRIDRPDVPKMTVLAEGLEACPENLAIVENGRVLYANRLFLETFGYPCLADLQGAPLARVIPANQVLACVPEAESQTARGASPAFDPAFVAIRRDGSCLKVQMSCSSFQTEQHDLLILSLRECLTQEPSNSVPSPQLESLGRLVGAVAHDFNNLLTGILLYCDLLVGGLEEHDPRRFYVAEIRRAGGHSAELIQQLMAVARPQSEEISPQSWNAVISGMRNLLTRLLGENVRLQIELSPNEADECVAMSAVPMRQIILNLLLNARDAMPQGGSIALSVGLCAECPREAGSARPSCIVLSVTDTGSGMDATTQSRLFRTVFTTKSPGKGTGLGLSTVGRIVKEHGGTIQVESEPGQGTRVRVHLPYAHEFATTNRPSHKGRKLKKR